MALVLDGENAAKAEEVKAKALELQKLVQESLSLQAVGGSHIANELNTVKRLADELLAADDGL